MAYKQCEELTERLPDPTGWAAYVVYHCLLRLNHVGEHLFESVTEDYAGTGQTVVYSEGYGVCRPGSHLIFKKSE